MTEQELLAIINGGESSTAQFKERLPHSDSLTDEIEIFDTSIKDIDTWLFSEYFKKKYKMSYEEKGMTLEEALINNKVMSNNHLTLAGLLFFGWEPQSLCPAFTIKFVMFIGNDIGGNNYKSKPEDLKGTIPELFKQGMMSIANNLL